MNEVVPDAIDVRIHHQRVNESENQHYPQRRVRKQKVEPEKIREMKKPRRGWNGIPARVREELGPRDRAFYSDRVSSHGPIGLGGPGTLADNHGFGKVGAVMSAPFRAVRGQSVIPVPVGRRQIRIC